jgi:hypothetical protein
LDTLGNNSEVPEKAGGRWWRSFGSILPGMTECYKESRDECLINKKIRKAYWIGHMVRGNLFLKHVTGEKIECRI